MCRCPAQCWHGVDRAVLVVPASWEPLRTTKIISRAFPVSVFACSLVCFACLPMLPSSLSCHFEDATCMPVLYSLNTTCLDSPKEVGCIYITVTCMLFSSPCLTTFPIGYHLNDTDSTRPRTILSPSVPMHAFFP